MKRIFAFSVMIMTMLIGWSSCDNSKTYAELLAEEQDAINAELNGKTVIKSPPSGDVLELGVFYALDNGVYMEVLVPGDLKVKASKGDYVNILYKRKNLLTGVQDNNGGNWYRATIRYGSSYEHGFGEGIEAPLKYVGTDSEVVVIIPSKQGPKSEISAVVPFLYTVRYNFQGDFED